MKNKIKDKDDLKKVVERLKKEGKRVVFTNGCFDLIHVGHTRYLEEAKKLGDILIVAVNSDQSVRTIKGNKRPIIPEEERAEVLSALQCVDFVVIFHEPDPLNIISLLKPDVLVKGGDWGEDAIIGREVVESIGGKVVRIPEIKGASSSSIINKIVNRKS
ncbi:MAG: D-glycero-beta-D-manno-heptose 1-phosphate adenylyltransferase [Desulfobacterales bacterium]|nr:D-glycero-beta-D-manno-heptose 1-phosphate adenylyltransferase [Desulfobacterales bacterium]